MNFFNDWANKKSDRDIYKLEVIEWGTKVTEEIELFDEKYPLYQMNLNEGPATIKMADSYFSDILHKLEYSISTMAKYKKIFSKYGVDIDQRVPFEWNLSAKSQYLRQRVFDEKNQYFSKQNNPELQHIV